MIIPSSDTHGRFSVRLKPGRKLGIDVCNPRDYFGEVVNRQHIGKSGNKLATQWNAEHPDDLVE